MVSQLGNCDPTGRASLRHPGRGAQLRRCSLLSPLAAARKRGLTEFQAEKITIRRVSCLGLGQRLPGSRAERHRARGRMFFSMICNREPPGFRDSGYNKGYGTLYAVGRYGYFWSSTIPSGSGNALYLHFYYEGIRQQSHCVRAYGFPLRCLQG